MYDSRIGQWLSEDPIGFDAGDANLRRYVLNQPTRLIDPNGLEPAAPAENSDADGKQWPTAVSGTSGIIDYLGVTVEKDPSTSTSIVEKGKIILGTQGQSKTLQAGALAHELVAGVLHSRFYGTSESGLNCEFDARLANGKAMLFPVSGSHNLGVVVELITIAQLDPSELTDAFIDERAGTIVVPLDRKGKKLPWQVEAEKITQFIKDANALRLKPGTKYTFKMVVFVCDSPFDKERLEIWGELIVGPRGIKSGRLWIKFYD